MEISEVRKRLLGTIERAKQAAVQRRAAVDEAARDYDIFLERVAVPLFRQVANVLKALGYPFQVFTPGGSVRLMSDRNAEDFIELYLDTSGARPVVMGRSSRARGRRVIEAEQALGSTVPELGEEQVLSFLLSELEPHVER
jgi:hypothetical protein